jgi:pRiA4b ORF-3-like protein
MTEFRPGIAARAGARGASQRTSQSRPRHWISVQVELVEGRAERYWPRPGRIFAAAADHSFAQLAEAIDDAFARWDRSHLHEFNLADGTRIGMPDPEGDDDEPVGDERILKLSRLNPGEQFVYVFDFGDDWAHLCTVGDSPIDPVETIGRVADRPIPFFGWGAIPDQYGRAWSADDGETKLPRDPGLRDLPPLRPGWGRGGQR